MEAAAMDVVPSSSIIGGAPPASIFSKELAARRRRPKTSVVAAVDVARRGCHRSPGAAVALELPPHMASSLEGNQAESSPAPGSMKPRRVPKAFGV